MNTIDITKLIFTDKLIGKNKLNIFPENGNFISRFNPSIINLKNNTYLITARCWLDTNILNSVKYPEPLEIGSPWNSGWDSIQRYKIDYVTTKTKDIELQTGGSSFTKVKSNSKKIDNKNYNSCSKDHIKPNINILAVVNLDFSDSNNPKFKLIHEQIIKLDCSLDGGEDIRLFKDNNNNIRMLFNTIKNEISDKLKNNKIYRFMATSNLGTPDKIINELTNNEFITNDSTNILCINLHQGKIEKNWSPYVYDNKNYIQYYTYGSLYPIITKKVLSYDSENTWKNKFKNTSETIKSFKNIHEFDKKSSLCSHSEISNIGINFKDITNIVNNQLNFPKKFVRFSGGTTSINIGNNEFISVGHTVFDVLKIKNNGIFLNDFIKDISLRPLLSSDNKYTQHHGANVYLLNIYKFTVDNNGYINKTKFGPIFKPPYGNVNLTQDGRQLDSGIVFPCGLEKINNDFILSYGVNDNRCVLWKFNLNDIWLNDNYDFHEKSLLYIDFNKSKKPINILHSNHKLVNLFKNNNKYNNNKYNNNCIIL